MIQRAALAGRESSRRVRSRRPVRKQRRSGCVGRGLGHLTHVVVHP